MQMQPAKALLVIMAGVALGTAYAVDAYAQVPDEVEIAALLPLTGELSSFGTQLDYAMELAVEDFNAYLEERGVAWRLGMVSEDTETNPVRALEKVQALHARGIDIIVGPAGSAQLSSILAYMNDNNMVAISPSSTAPALAIPDDAAFRTVPDDFNQGRAIGALLEHEGIEVVVPIWRGEVYGDGLVEAAVADFESRGGIVYEGVRYNPESSEFSVSVADLADTVSEVLEAHDADQTAVLIVAFDEAVPIFQVAATHDVLDDVRWFGGEAVAQSTVIASDKIASQFAIDTELSTVQLLLDPGDRADSVSERMREWLGSEPTAFVYTAYDAVWLAGLSVLESGSTDPVDLRGVIHQVAASYSGGALSSTDLNEAGDLVLANYETWLLREGGWMSGVSYDGQRDVIVSGGVAGEVLVGSLLPLTGGYSSVGVQVDAATRLAIDDFNAYLESKGAEWRFELLREDSSSNPVVSLEKIQSLHSRGADIVFGPAGSARVSSVKNYVDTNNMVLLSCCSTSPALSIPGDRVFRTVADDFNQGKALGKLLESRGIEAIVPLWIGDTYGDGLRDATVEDFESRGGVSDEGIRYNPDTSEFSVTVGALADRVQAMADTYGTENVGVVVVAFDEIVIILQASTAYGILGEVSWFGSETVAQSTPIVEDPLALQFSEQVGFTAVQLLLSTGLKAEHVRDSLADELGNSPDAFVYTGYDAVWLAGLSVEAANSADPSEMVSVLPSVAASYKGGALSSTELNGNGDLATANYEIWRVANGSWEKDSIFDIEQDTITPADAELMVDGTEFAPSHAMQGGSIQNMYTNPQAATLIIEIEAAEDGMLEITLPRDLVDSQTADGDDTSFFVLVDGEEIMHEETETADDSRTLVIEFLAGAEQVEIVGTSAAVPEFGEIVMVVLAAGLIAIAVFTARYRLVARSPLLRAD